MAERLLTLKQVSERTTLSATEIYRRVSKGTFPRQIKIGEQRTAWLESEVDAWIAKVSQERGAA